MGNRALGSKARLVACALAAASLFAAPDDARAFCGFYVSGAEGSLYANATMVVLLRDGTSTVLSMQNDYSGPPEDFAMVVPVPSVLSASDVRTLPRDVFTHIDALAAPRLVEYWETDPCFVNRSIDDLLAGALSGRSGGGSGGGGGGADLGVHVEAEFSVGEYDIAILSADDSSGLETWLHREHYNVPRGAGDVLRPYVEAGTKFFVARVDANRVTFEDGRAVLSPLRFAYDSPNLTLPVRLGLLNSQGVQDLIVHVLSREGRFEAANYPNTTIPTNLRVIDEVRTDFGGFYEYLFRAALYRAPNAVVTEYSWDASSCDPCPTPALTPSEIMTLGADVAFGGPSSGASGGSAGGGSLSGRRAWGGGWVLTRLHYRYSADTLGDDIVFRAAAALSGGRGVPAADGSIAIGASAGHGINQFQGRYYILHPWEGTPACAHPTRGRWGGPPSGAGRRATSLPNPAMATGAIPGASVSGAYFLAVDVPEIDAVAGAGPAPGSAAAMDALAAAEEERALERARIEAARTTSDEAGPSAVEAGSPDDSTGETDPLPSDAPASRPPTRGGCATCSARGASGALTAAGIAVLALVLSSRRARR